MRICEYFRSLQGEGTTIGTPTFFIRTVGCNLRCSWCDTGYAMEGGEEIRVDSLMDLIADEDLICITGGEPLLQNELPDLLARISKTGKKVVLETNGATDLKIIPNWNGLQISMDIKCPLSGMNDRMLPSNLDVIGAKDQVKFVIGNEEDLDFATRFILEHDIPATVIFSPVGGLKLDRLAEHVLENRLNVRVLPQLHKLIWGDKKSV